MATLHLQTHHPHYQPGESITGTLYAHFPHSISNTEGLTLKFTALEYLKYSQKTTLSEKNIVKDGDKVPQTEREGKVSPFEIQHQDVSQGLGVGIGSLILSFRSWTYKTRTTLHQKRQQLVLRNQPPRTKEGLWLSTNTTYARGYHSSRTVHLPLLYPHINHMARLPLKSYPRLKSQDSLPAHCNSRTFQRSFPNPRKESSDFEGSAAFGQCLQLQREDQQFVLFQQRIVRVWGLA